MNQTASSRSQYVQPLRGALFMVAAALTFALTNSGQQWAGSVNGIGSTTVAFYLYFFALIFALPWIWREGRKALATNNMRWHLLRAALSVAGIQIWVYAIGFIEIWQMIALVMTSPFFVILGAGLFLGEKITLTRVGATATGFAGAIIILQPWKTDFSLISTLPVLAAILWAGAALITKYLTRTEKSETITVYLLLLITPLNALLLFVANLGGGIFSGFSGFAIETMPDLWLLLGLGILTAAAQYFVTRAYAAADASYLQPFDDLKLPANVLVSWIVFSYAPAANFWPGAVLIVGASLFIAFRENKNA